MFNAYQTNTLSYNQAACIACMMCKMVCPQAVFIMRDRLAELVHPKACMGSVPARRIAQLMCSLLKVAWIALQ
jgi:Fe-S-cluster-containing hydrogenase component 2